MGRELKESVGNLLCRFFCLQPVLCERRVRYLLCMFIVCSPENSRARSGNRCTDFVSWVHVGFFVYLIFDLGRAFTLSDSLEFSMYCVYD